MLKLLYNNLRINYNDFVGPFYDNKYKVFKDIYDDFYLDTYEFTTVDEEFFWVMKFCSRQEVSRTELQYRVTYAAWYLDALKHVPDSSVVTYLVDDILDSYTKTRMKVLQSFIHEDLMRNETGPVEFGRHIVIDKVHESFRSILPILDKYSKTKFNKISKDLYNVYYHSIIPSSKMHRISYNIFFYLIMLLWILYLLDCTTSYKLLFSLFFSARTLFLIITIRSYYYIEYILVHIGSYYESEEEPDFTDFFHDFESARLFIHLYLLRILDTRLKSRIGLLSLARSTAVLFTIPALDSRIFSIFSTFFSKQRNTDSLFLLTFYIFVRMISFILVYYYVYVYSFVTFIKGFSVTLYLLYTEASFKSLFLFKLIYMYSTLTLEETLQEWDRDYRILIFFLEKGIIAYQLEILVMVLAVIGLFFSRIIQNKVSNEVPTFINDIKGLSVFKNIMNVNKDLLRSYVTFYIKGLAFLGWLRKVLLIYAVILLIYIFKSCRAYKSYGSLIGQNINYTKFVNIALTDDFSSSSLESTNEVFLQKDKLLESIFFNNGDLDLLTESYFNYTVFTSFLFFKVCLCLLSFILLLIYYDNIYYSYILLSTSNKYNNALPDSINKINLFNTYKKPDIISYLTVPSAEFIFLLLFVFSFSLLSVNALNMLITVLSIECITFAICYSLVFSFRLNATDASIKYFIISAVASCLLLYAITILFGVTGTIDFLQVSNILNYSIGLVTKQAALNTIFFIFFLFFFIKLGLYPFTPWSLDIYTHSSISTLFFFSVFSKFFFLFIFFKFFFIYGLGFKHVGMRTIILLFSVISIIFGTYQVVFESSLRRFLAYSSIIHFGYIIFIITYVEDSVGFTVVIAYLLNYILVNSVFFLIISKFSAIYKLEVITDLNKVYLDFTEYLAVFVCFLSLAGVPPTLGFSSKFMFYNFLMSINCSYLIIILLIFLSLLSTYGYFRVLRSLVTVRFFWNKINLLEQDSLIFKDQVSYQQLVAYYSIDHLFLVPYLTHMRFLIIQQSDKLLKCSRLVRSLVALSSLLEFTTYLNFNYFLHRIKLFFYIIIVFFLVQGTLAIKIIKSCVGAVSNNYKTPMDMFLIENTDFYLIGFTDFFNESIIFIVWTCYFILIFILFFYVASAVINAICVTYLVYRDSIPFTAFFDIYFDNSSLHNTVKAEVNLHGRDFKYDSWDHEDISYGSYYAPKIENTQPKPFHNYKF